QLHLSWLDVEGVSVRARAGADGRLNLASLTVPPRTQEKSSWGVVIDRVTVARARLDYAADGQGIHLADAGVEGAAARPAGGPIGGSDGGDDRRGGALAGAGGGGADRRPPAQDRRSPRRRRAARGDRRGRRDRARRARARRPGAGPAVRRRDPARRAHAGGG